ncbi:hypothetical protein M758_8G129600 [Ceratodon purpureus]|nr:hypothetical protein M758_8G129600 [Ceratodon purpureus]
MENPLDQSVIPPWRELGGEYLQQAWERLRQVGGYLMEWPFMCHAGLVLGAAWIASYLHFNVALVCILGFLYLFQIETKQRERLKRKIGYEERTKARKSRMAEGETVRWMNEMTEKLWPIFLEDFTSQMLLVPMNSFLDRFCKPWSVKKLVLQNLSLGKTPPTVTMVRLLPETSEGDDLAVEASLEWNAAKDMAAVLAVKVRRRLGLGMWATLHLCNLQIEGKMKIGVKFRDGWPVIERIRVCFAEAPYMDMECHPIYNSGVDVSELPGIASYLDRLVADALGQSLVEPNQMKIDVVKLVKYVLRPQGPAQTPIGDWFSFRGDPPAADVTLRILEATNLRVGDLNGYSDPYVRVTLNGTQHRETKVIWKTLNPKWNEAFGFTISSWEHPNTILLKVRDKDHIFDDQLGYQIVDLNLSAYRDGKDHDIWLPLLQVDTGKIHLVITVHERPTDSQSSEDVSNTNSATLEKGDHLMPQESDRPVRSEGLTTPLSPGYGQSQPTVASPKDRTSTRQRLKNLKSGKALSSDPAPEESSGKKVARQRSGFFSSSRSSRKVETPRGLGSDRETPSIPREGYSPMASSGVTSTGFAAPTEAEVADRSTDDTATILDVGFGEPGAVQICQSVDMQPTVEPSQWAVESKQAEGISYSEEGHTKTLDQALSEREYLTNIEEDGGAARKLRSAGLALHGKFHRARKGFEKDSETGSPRQDLQTRRKFTTTANGATEHVTYDPLDGQAANNPRAGLPSRPDSTATTPVNVYQGDHVMDAGISTGERDPEKHHLGTKAKGVFAKAAGQFSHQISKTINRRKKKDKEGHMSSEEVTTSGELTMGSGPIGPVSKEVGPGTEVPVTGQGTQQQIPPTSKLSDPPAPTSSVPPNRPPPGLPQPVAPNNLHEDNETTHSSQPLRPLPTYSDDTQQSSPTKGQKPLQTQGPLPIFSDGTQESSPPEQKVLNTQGLVQPAPPPAVNELDGTSISPL